MVKGIMTFKPNKGGMITVQIDVPASPEAIMELAPNYGKEMSPMPVEVKGTTTENECTRCGARDGIIRQYVSLFLTPPMYPEKDEAGYEVKVYTTAEEQGKGVL